MPVIFIYLILCARWCIHVVLSLFPLLFAEAQSRLLSSVQVFVHVALLCVLILQGLLLLPHICIGWLLCVYFCSLVHVGKKSNIPLPTCYDLVSLYIRNCICMNDIWGGLVTIDADDLFKHMKTVHILMFITSFNLKCVCTLYLGFRWKIDSAWRLRMMNLKVG